MLVQCIDTHHCVYVHNLQLQIHEKQTQFVFVLAGEPSKKKKKFFFCS